MQQSLTFAGVELGDITVETLQWPSTTVAFSLGDLFVTDGILQRSTAVPIWGRATTGLSVSVTIDGVTRTAVADALGVWVATMPSHAAGGPYSLVVTCNGTTITRTGIYYGDV